MHRIRGRICGTHGPVTVSSVSGCVLKPGLAGILDQDVDTARCTLEEALRFQPCELPHKLTGCEPQLGAQIVRMPSIATSKDVENARQERTASGEGLSALGRFGSPVADSFDSLEESLGDLLWPPNRLCAALYQAQTACSLRLLDTPGNNEYRPTISQCPIDRDQAATLLARLYHKKPTGQRAEDSVALRKMMPKWRRICGKFRDNDTLPLFNDSFSKPTVLSGIHSPHARPEDGNSPAIHRQSGSVRLAVDAARQTANDGDSHCCQLARETSCLTNTVRAGTSGSDNPNGHGVRVCPVTSTKEHQRHLRQIVQTGRPARLATKQRNRLIFGQALPFHGRKVMPFPLHDTSTCTWSHQVRRVIRGKEPIKKSGDGLDAAETLEETILELRLVERREMETNPVSRLHGRRAGLRRKGREAGDGECNRLDAARKDSARRREDR